MNNVMSIVVQVAVVLFAISIHESAHGWMAEKFGDPTARMQGRITLNPIAHIDPVGTILVPMIMIFAGIAPIGWAKPVLVNPYNLKNPRKDGMFISAAGPISNLITAAVAIFLFIILKPLLVNYFFVKLILLYLIVISIYLAIFNLIPIPPLDGSGILEGFLKGEALVLYEKVKPYGFILFLVIVYSGALGLIANPILNLVYRILGV